MNFFRRLLGRSKIESSLAEEMAFHRQARIDDLVARGIAPEEAARQASIEFGSSASYTEECRAALGYRLWDELTSDLRYAARGIRKSPGFSAAAVAILALAIGANGTFFTLLSHFVLKPLPIRGFERHFDIESFDKNSRSAGGWSRAELDVMRQSSIGKIEDFYSMGMMQVLMLTPVQRHGLVTGVSSNFFDLLGGKARMGRTIAASEENQNLAVLSDSGWRRLLAADPAALGKSIRIKSTLFTVVGVMPPEFTGTEAAVPDFWIGLKQLRLVRTSEATEGEARNAVSGLLAPGVSPKEAEELLSAVATRFTRPGRDPVARLELVPRPSYLPQLTEVSIAGALCLAAFLMVLLIACANLANLYLARATSRTHEIAMRISLGASRFRIVRQLLTESIFIASLGAAAGIGLASISIQEAQVYLFSIASGMGIPMQPVEMDWRVVLYSAALGVLAGIAFGLLPALEVTSPSLTQSTKRENSTFMGRIQPRRMRDLLIGGQVAASLVLLILAGVLVRNIQKLDTASTGYDLDRIYDLRVDKTTPEFIAQLERIPGIGVVSAVDRAPLMGQLSRVDALANNQNVRLRFNQTDHRYFDVLGLKVEAGRTYTALEARSEAKVAVISKATATRLWPGESPLGKTIQMDLSSNGDPKSGKTYTVIGQVPDVTKGFLFMGKDTTAIYIPAAAGQVGITSAIARIVGNPASAMAAVRALCADGAEASGCEPMSLRAVSAQHRFPFQAAAGVSAILGILALALTAVGLYTVSSYSVLQRRREIGIHLALGATGAQVMRRILGEAWRCTLWGVIVGMPVCLVLSKLATSAILQIQTFDLITYTGVPVMLVVIAILACALPARKAARLDPMLSLREE